MLAAPGRGSIHAIYMKPPPGVLSYKPAKEELIWTNHFKKSKLKVVFF